MHSPSPRSIARLSSPLDELKPQHGERIAPPPADEAPAAIEGVADGTTQPVEGTADSARTVVDTTIGTL